MASGAYRRPTALVGTPARSFPVVDGNNALQKVLGTALLLGAHFR